MMIKKIYTTNFKLKIASLSLDCECLVDLSKKFGVEVSQILEWRNLLSDESVTQLFLGNEAKAFPKNNNKDFMYIKIKGYK